MIDDQFARLEMDDYQRLLPPELNLTLQQPLNGDGCFGPVFDAIFPHEGGSSPLAVKRVVRFLRPVPDVTKWPRNLMDRFGRLDGVWLPYVSTARSVGMAEGWLYLVGDRHEKTLDSLLKINPHGLSKEAAWNIAEQLIEGLGALHAIGIAHGDLRPKRIFVDQHANGFRPMVSIGDPLLGEVNWASNGSLVDNDAQDYRVPDQKCSLVEPTPQADLYALGCIVCELVMGPEGNPNRQYATEGQEADHQPVAPTFGDHRELAIVVELLVGRNRASLANAVALRRELAARKLQIQKKAKRRAIKALGAGLLVLLAAGLFTWASHSAKVIAENKTAAALVRIKQLEDDLASQKQALDDLNTQVVGLKSLLDSAKQEADTQKAMVTKLERENEDLRTENEELKRQLHNVPKDEKDARQAWETAVQDRKNRKEPTPEYSELDDFEEVYIKWGKLGQSDAPQGVNPKEVGKHLGQWFNTIRELKDDAGVWLGHDATLDRLYTSARANPWDRAKMNAARDRRQGLETAAAVWDRYAKSSTLTWGDVHSAVATFSEPSIGTKANAEARQVLKGWLLEMARIKFTLKLGAVTGTTEDLVTVYTGADSKDWPDGGLNYPDAAANKIPFDWHPGEAVSVLLEGPRGIWSGGARPNLIGPTPFDGPLAPYQMHRAGSVISTDGKVTLQFTVLNCPGPPPHWKPALPIPSTPIPTTPNP